VNQRFNLLAIPDRRLLLLTKWLARPRCRVRLPFAVTPFYVEAWCVRQTEVDPRGCLCQLPQLHPGHGWLHQQYVVAVARQICGDITLSYQPAVIPSPDRLCPASFSGHVRCRAERWRPQQHTASRGSRRKGSGECKPALNLFTNHSVQ